MDKLKALPVTIILLLENLKTKMEEIAVAATIEERMRAIAEARISIEFMVGVAGESAAEVEGLG
jgi:hypothetical protein